MPGLVPPGALAWRDGRALAAPWPRLDGVRPGALRATRPRPRPRALIYARLLVPARPRTRDAVVVL